jgi:hypothetical protein
MEQTLLKGVCSIVDLCIDITFKESLFECDINVDLREFGCGEVKWM